MKVLFLGSSKNKIIPFLEKENEVHVTDDKISANFIKANHFDFIVSFGYRYIIKPDVINFFPKGKIVNLHIAYLPYNRGADPNFWSFFDNTPKGVTIHCIDEGLDTGDILCQKEVQFKDLETHTLSTTYEILINEMLNLFMKNWDLLKSGELPPVKQEESLATYHRSKDKIPFFENYFPENWDASVKEITNHGHNLRHKDL